MTDEKWISVEDRLPEENEKYLFCIQDKENNKEIIILKYVIVDGISYFTDEREVTLSLEQVTHWKELPDFP